MTNISEEIVPVVPDIPDPNRRRGLTSWGKNVLNDNSSDESVMPYSITEDDLTARSKRTNAGLFWKQLFVCFAVTMGSMNAGYTVGSTAPKIRHYYNLAHGKYNPGYARFASIVSMGLAIGTIFVSTLTMARGPRKMILITAPFNIVCWLLMPVMDSPAYTNTCMFFCAFLSIGYLHCGNLLMRDGIHEAYYYPLFLTFRSGYGFGVMLGYILGHHENLTYFSDSWAAFTLLVLFIAVFKCPESPVFVYHNNPLKAQKALIFYRGTQDIPVLMRQIRKDHDARILSISTKYMLFYRVVYKAIFIILTLAMLQCFYAYNIFLMYNVALWYSSTKYKQVDAIGEREDSVILGIAYYIIPLIAEAVNLKMTFGLRKPVMATAITAPLTLVIHSLFFHVLFHTTYLARWHWLVFVVRIMHIICVNFSYTWSIDTMISNYLPEQIQEWASIGIFTARYLMLSFLLWVTFLMESKLDASIIIAFFALVSFAGIPFCYYFVIESKGRTLQQVQMALGGNPIGTRNTFAHRHQQYIAEKKRRLEEERKARERYYRDF